MFSYTHFKDFVKIHLKNGKDAIFDVSDILLKDTPYYQSKNIYININHNNTFSHMLEVFKKEISKELSTCIHIPSILRVKLQSTPTSQVLTDIFSENGQTTQRISYLELKQNSKISIRIKLVGVSQNYLQFKALQIKVNNG